jgi:DNA-binding MarR family transcriptional regulator
MAAATPAKTKAARAVDLTDNPLAHEIYFLLARVSSSGTREGNRRLAPLGLRVRSYSVLSLACEETPPSQRSLAEFLDLDPSQVVSLVDDLESRGLAERLVDSDDRRTKVVRATEKGRRLRASAAAATAHAEDESLSHLSSQQRNTLKSLLRALLFDSHDGSR